MLLVVSYHWDQSKLKHFRMNPSGRMIGYGAIFLRLHRYLRLCKLFHLRAILHDAMGFLYKAYGVRNGYDYIFGSPSVRWQVM